jgi:Fe-S cluster biosynthesis and repair protein YggX
MADDPRIEQFKKMAEADPANELGHFSLGKAYLDAGNTSAAIAPLQRAIELNPDVTRAYQFLAQAMLKENRQPDAIAMLNRGVEIATKRGDFAPRNEMVRMLKELGAPVPQEAAATPQAPAAGEGQVVCGKCGKAGKKMASPPFSGDFGKEIYEKICADCWRAWIGMGTKVINELRLPLSDPQARKIFDQHMREFLNLSK